MAISLKYKDETYLNNHYLLLDSNFQTLKTEVIVDDKFNCNDFNISLISDWIKIKRIRNLVDIIIESNLLPHQYILIDVQQKKK